MIRPLAIALLVVACGTSKAPPGPSPAPAGSASPPAAPAARPYAGPPERGPCASAHDCVLRDVCGCSCEAVVLSAPRVTACDESCPAKDACAGYAVICDLGTRTCGAIPPPR